MKVLVFGNSGSGKSTYARALAGREDLAHLDSDSIVWGVWEPGKIQPGKIPEQRPDEAVAASLRNFIHSHAAWVIEGCYGELIRAASAHCTLLVFLNPGIDACLANNLKRPWESHKYPSLEIQNSMLDQLQKWVAEYYQRTDAYSYRVHREIFDAFAGPKGSIKRWGHTPLTTDRSRLPRAGCRDLFPSRSRSEELPLSKRIR